MSQGPTNPITRQPLDGKNAQGGLKIGEMEKDALVSHGSANLIYQKMTTDSDGFTIYFCIKCNEQAIVNEDKEKVYKCKNCDTDTYIKKMPSSWMTNILFKYLSSININTKIFTSPVQFSK